TRARLPGRAAAWRLRDELTGGRGQIEGTTCRGICDTGRRGSRGSIEPRPGVDGGAILARRLGTPMLNGDPLAEFRGARVSRARGLVHDHARRALYEIRLRETLHPAMSELESLRVECLREHFQCLDEPRARAVEIGITVRGPRAAILNRLQHSPFGTSC